MNWDAFPERCRAELKRLMNEYQHQRQIIRLRILIQFTCNRSQAAKKHVVAAAGFLGADETPDLLRKLNTSPLDEQHILIAVDENGRANSNLLLMVLGDSADKSPFIQSTQDLQSLLLTSSSTQTRGKTFSGLTGGWPSCIMELLQLEIVRFQL